ncbi:MAG TPA: DotU family type IV/VI secretion system protein [Polyangiaceae bacterium]|nr:DotU family type IV/VI secretion system protein [Polyangiaceae bacterium]
MDTKTALWFAIDDTFAELYELCLEARAAELVVQQRQAEELVVRSLSAGRTAPQTALPTEEGRYARAVDLAREASFRERHAAGADIVMMRASIRRRLGELRARLAEVLAEHEVYYVLFPIVVYADELVATATRGAANRWEPMQSEFYEIDNGGELFYVVCEERLRQDETHPLVFEAFYFCLADGFTGMYPSGSKKIEDTKARLLERIAKPELRFPELKRESRRAELVAFPWWVYAVAASTLLVVYTALSWSAG